MMRRSRRKVVVVASWCLVIGSAGCGEVSNHTIKPMMQSRSVAAAKITESGNLAVKKKNARDRRMVACRYGDGVAVVRNGDVTTSKAVSAHIGYAKRICGAGSAGRAREESERDMAALRASHVARAFSLRVVKLAACLHGDGVHITLTAASALLGSGRIRPRDLWIQPMARRCRGAVGG